MATGEDVDKKPSCQNVAAKMTMKTTVVAVKARRMMEKALQNKLDCKVEASVLLR